jgi:hypothetical protein
VKARGALTTADRPTPNAAAPPAERPSWRSVAIPSEHGGWGLTVEPGLLGLLIAPSRAGGCIAAAALVAFVLRTPAKLVAVDLRRGRRLPRTALAARVAAAEAVALAVLVAGAVAWGAPGFWLPALAALPFVAVEAWFEVRSRGRRLAPELAGAVAVASVAAMVLLAGGESAALAVGAWAVLAGRSMTSIPHVRAQIALLRGRFEPRWTTTVGDGAAVVLAAAAVALDTHLLAGAIAVAGVVVAQSVAEHRLTPRPTVIGIHQTLLGLAVVVATAVGVLVTS